MRAFLFSLLIVLPITAHCGINELVNDGKLEIVIALGYHGDYRSDGNPSRIPILAPLLDAFNDNIPESPMFLDNDLSGFKHALRRIGFSASPHPSRFPTYYQSYKFNGRRIEAKVELIYWQKRGRVAELNEIFKDALFSKDVIIYAGHSLGGTGFPYLGPYRSATELPFYKNSFEKWIGFDFPEAKRRRDQIVLLNSCKSRAYYLDAISPHVGTAITTNYDTYFHHYPATSIALIEGIMMGHSDQMTIDNMNKLAGYLEKEGTVPLFTFDGAEW